jgi:threonine aldolase
VGSLVASSSERIEEARSVRKLLGGGMRQTGVLAAAGLVALEENLPRLAEDHDRARLLGDALARGRGVRVTPPRTNIVVATLDDGNAVEVATALSERGVLTIAMDGRTLRLVTHRDVSEADCGRAAEAIERVVG